MEVLAHIVLVAKAEVAAQVLVLASVHIFLRAGGLVAGTASLQHRRFAELAPVISLLEHVLFAGLP